MVLRHGNDIYRQIETIHCADTSVSYAKRKIYVFKRRMKSDMTSASRKSCERVLHGPEAATKNNLGPYVDLLMWDGATSLKLVRGCNDLEGLFPRTIARRYSGWSPCNDLETIVWILNPVQKLTGDQ